MTKTYHFIDDSYIYSVCDCCGPTEMPVFNIDRDMHPDFPVEYGSAHSVEECMEQVLMAEGVLSEDCRDDVFNDPMFDEYAHYLYLLSRNGLTVFIDGEEV
jgi:hypothetical protein